MARLLPTDLTSTYGAVAALNANFDDIAELFEQVVFRDGRSPNSMSANFDLNHFKINNLGAPSSLADAARLQDVNEALAEGVTLTTASGEAFSSKALMAAASDQSSGQGALLMESGAEGIFRWDSSDLSDEVSADTGQAVYIPPTSDTTGASGAWVRQYSGTLRPEWGGAIGNNVADDTTPIMEALALGPVEAKQHYHVAGLAIGTSDPVIMSGGGTIESTTDDQSGFSLNPLITPMRGAHITGMNFRHAQSPNLGAGLDDDYSAFRAAGQENAHFSHFDVSDSDVGFSCQFGVAALGDRRNYDVTGENIYGTNIRGMGFELFGICRGNFSGYFVGDDGSGGRAMFHGVRIHAFDFAANENLNVRVHAENFANGLSLQRNSRNNWVQITAIDCERGVHVHGTDEEAADPTLTRDQLSTGNYVLLTAKDCDYALYDGGSDNWFNVSATGCTNGIRAIAGVEVGFGVNNSYQGSVTDGLGRLAWISQTGAKIDLTLGGRNVTDATYGLLLDGNKCRGSVRVSLCGQGAWISGSDNVLDVTAHDCTAPLTITGNGNVITGVINGNVTITGSNNILLARVTGTVTDSGTGNRKITGTDTGWTAATGTAFKGTFATFPQSYGTGTAGPTLTDPPTTAELQTMANELAKTQNALLTAHRRLKAIDDLLRSRGDTGT